MHKLGPKVKCLACLEVIQSTYRHDFVSCFCGKLSVDGGGDYLRILWDRNKTPKEAYEILKESNS